MKVQASTLVRFSGRRLEAGFGRAVSNFLQPPEPDFCGSGRCLGPDAGRVLQVARGSICGGGHGSQSGSVLEHTFGIEWLRGEHLASPGASSFFVRHWKPSARLVMFGSF